MADFTLADLKALPTPEILEVPDYQAILSERKKKLVELAPQYGFEYDVADLETDPGVIVTEEASYREIVLRERGNDIGRARYLAFAKSAETDHLGRFYDCTRMPGEDDDRYKERIILAIRGRSTGGTEARYKALAMEASLRVADAKVYVLEKSPVVHIAVFATDNNGVADAPLLAAVEAAVNPPTARMVNDHISVRSAVVRVVDVSANIVLLPTASADIVTRMAANLPALWQAESGLGTDLTLDWVRARLMQPGVYKVTPTAPASDVVVQPFEAVRLGTVTLTITGRNQ